MSVITTSLSNLPTWALLLLLIFVLVIVASGLAWANGVLGAMYDNAFHFGDSDL